MACADCGCVECEPKESGPVLRLSIRPECDADVLVVGGGPAGAAAAAYIARAGKRVIVLDRDAFPRDKVCGDFVGPTALLELERLGVTSRPEYRQTNVIRQAALHLNGEELIRRLIPEVRGLPAYGRVIPRALLDAWILDAARQSRAVIIEGARVVDFAADAAGVTVVADLAGARRIFGAKLLIGADGSNSVISRPLRGRRPKDEDRIVAVRAYFDGDVGPEDRADLYFTAESFPGYYWLFPTGRGKANVGVGMVLETIPPSSDRLRELLLELVATDRALRDRLQRGRIAGKVVGWPLSTYNSSLPVTGERVMLAGDAAGLINPLNGEGIQYALMSGRWAAEAAIECLAADDYSPEPLRAYADRIAGAMRYDMALAGLIVQAIRNRALNPLWLEALRIICSRARADPEYAEICGGILAGLLPARDALTAKVIGRTLDHAVYSAALYVLWEVLKGPTNVGNRAADGARTAIDIANESLKDPGGTLDWFLRLALHSGELAAQFARSLGDEPATAAAPRAVAVTLKIPLDHVENHLLDELLVR